jgi:hypothetical protein
MPWPSSSHGMYVRADNSIRHTRANSFLTAAFQPDLNCSCRSHPDRDENAKLARFSNLLAHYTGEKGDQNIASRAMRYLATPEIATADLSAPVLLAEMQFTHTVAVSISRAASAPWSLGWMNGRRPEVGGSKVIQDTPIRDYATSPTTYFGNAFGVGSGGRKPPCGDQRAAGESREEDSR